MAVCIIIPSHSTIAGYIGYGKVLHSRTVFYIEINLGATNENPPSLKKKEGKMAFKKSSKY